MPPTPIAVVCECGEPDHVDPHSLKWERHPGGWLRAAYGCRCGEVLVIDTMPFDGDVPPTPEERAAEIAQNILDDVRLRSEREALRYGGSW